MKKVYYLILLALILGGSAGAQVIRYVTPAGAGVKDGTSWANAYDGTQLQVAINAAGVTQVWVAAGTYKPTTGTDRGVSFHMKNGVSILGGFAGNETGESQRNPAVNVSVLSGDLNGDDVVSGSGSSLSFQNDAENSYSVIHNEAQAANPITSSAVLDGFTISGGYANAWGNGSYMNGSGMFNYSASPTVSNCIFYANRVEGGGGAVFNSAGCSPTFTNVVFLQNYAQANGGGIYNYTGTNVTMTNCSFTGNMAYGSFGGGSVMAVNSTLTLSGCRSTGNFSSVGGEMSLIGENVTMTNCSFINGGAYQDAGGFWIEGSTAVLTNCVISGHRCNFYGGAIYNRSSNVSLTNCTLFDNFVNLNYGPYNQTAVFSIDGTSTTTLDNCIVWGNGNFSNSTAPVINNSIFQGGWSGAGSNNVNSNPLYASTTNPIGPDGIPGTSDDGLRLLYSSPAINAGNNALNGNTADVTGNARRQGTIDIGAYEFQASPVPALTVIPGGPTTICPGSTVPLFASAGGNGLRLNGSYQYLLTPNMAGVFPNSGMTLELWFKAFGPGVIADELDPPLQNAAWHDSQIEILADGHLKVRVWDMGAVDLGTVAFGTWHHAVVRYNQASSLLDGFLDGVAAASPVSGFRQRPTAQYWAFGASDVTNLGSGAWFNGEIDEVRIWNTARTNPEIQQNYMSTVDPASTGLVAYYKLDETSGTTAYDATSHGYNATVVGGAMRMVPSGSPVGGAVLWSNGATGATCSASLPGSYTFQLTNAGGYTGTSTAATVQYIQFPVPPVTSNNALSFDGADDQVSLLNCGGTPIINGGDAITVEYWFKGANSQSAVRLQPDGGTFIVAAWQNSVHILSNDGGTLNGLSAGTGFNDGNWHHMAFTWQRNTLNGFKSYLDGNLVAERNSSNDPLPVIASGMYLGAYLGAGERMQGALDEVRIWTVARSQEELRAGICNFALPQNGLVAWYRFDHGTAGGDNAAITSVANSTGNNMFTGQLENFGLNGNSSNWVASQSMLLPVSVSIQASANPVAAGTSVTFTASAVNGGNAPGYQWYLNGQAAGSNLPAFTFNPQNGDQVSCTLSSNAACASPGASSNVITMQVTGVLPAASVSGTVSGGQSRCYDATQTLTVAGGGTLFTVSSGASANLIAGVNILFEPGTTVVAGGYLHGSITQTGQYCMPPPAAPAQAATDPQPVKASVSGSSMILYPNPTRGDVTLEIRGGETPGKVTVEIYALHGERLFTAALTGERKHQFATGGLPAGIYFVRVTTGEGTQTMRLIKME